MRPVFIVLMFEHYLCRHLLLVNRRLDEWHHSRFPRKRLGFHIGLLLGYLLFGRPIPLVNLLHVRDIAYRHLPLLYSPTPIFISEFTTVDTVLSNDAKKYSKCLRLAYVDPQRHT